MIKKVKNTVEWTYLIQDLNGEEIAGTFQEKELKQSLKLKKQYKKSINCIISGNFMIIRLIAG